MHVLARVASGGDERHRQVWADQFIATLDMASTDISTSITVPDHSGTQPQTPKTRRALPWRKIVALGTACAIILGGAGIFLRPDAAPKDTPMRVAVLPFENLSETNNNSYISAGITDEIIQSLSQIPDLYVSPRRDSQSISRQNLSVKDIGNTLGVGYVLDGTLRVDAGRMKLNAALVQIESGEHVWSGKFNDQTDDLFSIQEEVAEGVTEALDIVMSPDRRANMFNFGTENIEAYRQYLKGRHLMKFWHETHEGDDIWRAGEALEAAVTADPAMGRAWVHMADLYHHFAAGHINAPATGLNVTVPGTQDKILNHLRQVLEQGERHGDTTTALQAKANRIFYSNDWTALRPAVLKYAEQVIPQRGELEWLYVPVLLSLLGETDTQTRLMDDRVLKYDPGNGTGHAYVVRQHLNDGNYAAAKERLSKAEASSFSSRLAEVRGYMLVAERNGPELRAHLAASADRLSPLLSDYFSVLSHYFNAEGSKAMTLLENSPPLQSEKIHLAFAHHHMNNTEKSGEIFAEVASTPIGVVQIAVLLSYGAGCGPHHLPPISPLEARLEEAGVSHIPCIGMPVTTAKRESAKN